MTLLRNSFSFGFELEAFGRNKTYAPDFDYDYFDEDYECYDDMPCNYLNDYDGVLGRFYNNINKHIEYNYNMEGHTHYDGSVKHYNDGYTAFEWSSPVLNFTTSNLLRVKRFLMNLNKEDIYINNTCGFHTHFSYKGICEKDVIWILTYIAMNTDAFDTFTSFHYKNRKDGELFPEDVKVDFFNERYADKEYLERIREFMTKKDYESLSTIFNDYKYRVLRVHPQGTMEWRGPREFLYTKNGVKTYIDTLYKVVDIFIKALKTASIGGVSKDEFFDNLKTNCISNAEANILPDVTLKQKRSGSFGILPWFYDRGHYDKKQRCHHYMTDVVLDGFINKIKKIPSEINDMKYSDYLKPIIRKLNSDNCLRRVVEYNVNNGIKLSKNVQYLMLFENITLLPYVERTTWKYIPQNTLLNCILPSNKFREETRYKHQTLDYIVNELPLVYKPCDVLRIIRTLVSLNNVDWIVKYLTENLKTKFFEILDKSYKNDDKTLLETVKDKLLKNPTASLLANVVSFVVYGVKGDLFDDNKSITTLTPEYNFASNITSTNNTDYTIVATGPNYNNFVGNVDRMESQNNLISDNLVNRVITTQVD